VCFQSRRKSRACHLLQKEVRWSQRDVREKHLTRAFRYYLSMHTAVYILCFFNLICPRVVVYIVPWNCALNGSNGVGFRRGGNVFPMHLWCVCVCVCVCVCEREREGEIPSSNFCSKLFPPKLYHRHRISYIPSLFHYVLAFLQVDGNMKAI